MQPTDPSKFTDKAWEAIVKSQDVARRFQNQQLEVEHLIIALLEQNGFATTLLMRAGIDPENLTQQLEAFAKRQPRVGKIDDLYLGRGLDLLLDGAEQTRQSWEDEFISIEHLLLAFAGDERIGRRLLGGERQPQPSPPPPPGNVTPPTPAPPPRGPPPQKARRRHQSRPGKRQS